MKRIFAAVAALIVAGTLWSAPRTNGEYGERNDLLPTRTRWQFYARDVRSVKVDRTGRPWFQVSRSGERLDLDELKDRIEKACDLKAPWISDAKMLLFDSAGRIWLAPHCRPKLLLGYDPKAHEWIERPIAHPDPSAYVVLGPAHESRSGRLYFGDDLGVHVYADGRWTYEPLHDANMQEEKPHGDGRAFNPVHFAEDEQGTVFAWSGWGSGSRRGTLGYLAHTGETWSRVRKCKQGPIERLRCLVPLKGGHALFVPAEGAAFIARIGSPAPRMREEIERDIRLLGAAEFKEREAAERRLAAVGPFALPYLQAARAGCDDPEVIMRLDRLIPRRTTQEPKVDGHVLRNARAYCRDAQGRTWLLVSECHTPDSARVRDAYWLIGPDGRVSPGPEAARNWHPDSTFVDSRGRIYFARYERGCAVLDGDTFRPVTDRTQTSYRYLLGEDRDGRIYLSGGRTIAAYGPEYPDTRPGLRTDVFEVPREENGVCIDSAGRVWAKLLGPQYPLLNVFEDGEWRGPALPDGERPVEKLCFLQPLKEGMVVAQEQPRGRSFLVQERDCRSYDTLRELVEREYDRLTRLIDNRRFGRDFYAKLRLDGQRRVWVVEWMGLAVCDGRQWTDVAAALNQPAKRVDIFHHCVPVDGAAAMLLADSRGPIYRASIGDGALLFEPFQFLGGRSLRSDYTSRSGLWMDSGGRVWLPSNATNCVLMQDGRQTKVIDSGFPRFEDSAGCIWCLAPQRRQLVVIDRRGGRAVLPEEWLHETSAVAEGRPGSFWIGTERGLLHVVKVPSADGQGFALKKVRHYEKDVPKGMCLLMVIDAERNLWFYGPGPDEYRLYRVRLPAPDQN